MNIFGAKDDNKRSADLTVEGAANQLPHTFRLSRRASIPTVSSASSPHKEEASMIRQDREYQEALLCDPPRRQLL